MDRQRESGRSLKNHGVEVSVTDAAQILQVTERTVLNFIREKRIIAVKVGKSWFVDQASIMAFKAGRSPADSAEGGHTASRVEPNRAEYFSEKMVVSEKPPSFSEKATSVSEKRQSVSEKPRPVSETRPEGGRPRLGVRGLNCYRMAVDIFAMESWRAGDSSDAFSFGGAISKELLINRIGVLQLQILETLGAGYHSFGSAKVTQYGKARAAAGSLLALISANGTIGAALEAERAAVEEKLLPALIALQRTAEKRGLHTTRG